MPVLVYCEEFAWQTVGGAELQHVRFAPSSCSGEDLPHAASEREFRGLPEVFSPIQVKG